MLEITIHIEGADLVDDVIETPLPFTNDHRLSHQLRKIGVVNITWCSAMDSPLLLPAGRRSVAEVSDEM